MARLAPLVLLLISCAARQHGAGEYHGPNVLDFSLQSPMQRAMPQERHAGSAIVDDAGDHVILELRIFGNEGTPCRVSAYPSQSERGRYDIPPGQQCASNFRYDGNPVTALVQIDVGVAEFDHRRLMIAMQGPFVADVRTADGRVVPTQGFATWRFEGFR